MNKHTVSRLMALLLAIVTIFSLTACGAKEEAAANTVGNVSVTMDVAKVDVTGKTVFGLGASRIEHNDYPLQGGCSYSMDPTIHVGRKSADCWVFARITNGIASVEAPAEEFGTVAEQLAANGWVPVEGTENVYAHDSIAKAGEDLLLFEKFAISKDVSSADLSGLETPEILVQVYAVEANGYDAPEGAWQDAGF